MPADSGVHWYEIRRGTLDGEYAITLDPELEDDGSIAWPPSDPVAVITAAQRVLLVVEQRRLTMTESSLANVKSTGR